MYFNIDNDLIGVEFFPTNLPKLLLLLHLR